MPSGNGTLWPYAHDMSPKEKSEQRPRTAAQQAQKREVDRAKKKLNRAETKTRLERIEKEIGRLGDVTKDTRHQVLNLRRDLIGQKIGARDEKLQVELLGDQTPQVGR